jgi:hypothetical protein
VRLALRRPYTSAIAAFTVVHAGALAQITAVDNTALRIMQSPAVPPTEMVIEKFRKLSGRRLGAAQVERIVESVMAAERLQDAGELARLLARVA